MGNMRTSTRKNKHEENKKQKLQGPFQAPLLYVTLVSCHSRNYRHSYGSDKASCFDRKVGGRKIATREKNPSMRACDVLTLILMVGSNDQPSLSAIFKLI